MYTVALALCIGFVAHFVQTELFALNERSRYGLPIEKIPLLKDNEDLWGALFCVLAVWFTDVSILSKFGMGNTAQWVDVVGSGIVVWALHDLWHNVNRYFNPQNL